MCTGVTMDRINDRNDNNDKNSLNWQNKQRNNNNLDSFINNEKNGENGWKSTTTTATSTNSVATTNGKNETKNNSAGQDDRDEIVDDCESEDGSTDNLSFSIDNDLIDDIVLLPDNVISEDEVSNPDNCVYAYRGSPEPLHRHSQPQDDETDFLEMDFDPEPNSDADVSGFVDLDQPSGMVVPTSMRHSPEFEEQKQEKNGVSVEINGKCNSIATHMTNSPIVLANSSKNSSPDKHYGECSTSSRESSSSSCLRHTGAIPKKPSLHKTNSQQSNEPSSSKGHQDHHNASQQNMKSNQLSYSTEDTRHNFKINQPSRHGGDRIQFDKKSKRAANTKGGNCDNSKSTSERTLETIDNNRSSLDNQLNATISLIEEKHATYSKCNRDYSYQTEDFIENFDKNNLNGLCTQDGEEKTFVDLFSVNLDEKTLIDGLESVGLEPNKILIKSYYAEREQFRNSEHMNRLNIPEYLTHVAKENCDYKRIIELIRCACIDVPVSARFYPFDDYLRSDDKVNVQAREIMKRWTRNTNLMEISRIRNKNFNKMNVLGKVINILRQPTQRRDVELDSFLVIPQYYRSGYIRVRKIT